MDDSSLILIEELMDRLQHQEDLEFELKAAQGGIPKSLWETVSAFANTNGGWIILGVDEADGFKTIGVKNARKRLQEFFNEVRNHKKISYPVCGPHDAFVQSLDSKDLIIVRVPAVARRHRPVFVGSNPYEGTYIRLHAGDYKCRKPEVDRMMRDASDASVDSTVLQGFSIDDLDPMSIARYRRRFQTLRPESAWTGYDDLQFLSAIGAYGRNRDNQTEGITVAGLLFFGKDSAIRDWRTHHIIDFQVTSIDPAKRWDDRLVWEGNLLGAFEEIFLRLTRDLAVPFKLEAGMRVEGSPVHVALREALINLLVHSDYSELDRSLVIKSNEGCLFRNPGRSSQVPEVL